MVMLQVPLCQSMNEVTQHDMPTAWCQQKQVPANRYLPPRSAHYLRKPILPIDRSKQ